MASQDWVNLLNWSAPWQTTQGTALSATATTATISPQAAGPQDFVLPTQSTGTQFYTSMALKIEATGTINTGGTASNLTVFPAIGVSGTLATTLATTAAIALGTGTLTGLEWSMWCVINCIGSGSSGNTLSTEGQMHIQTSTAGLAIGTANDTVAPLPFTAIAFNTYTAATAIGLRATLSAAFGLIQCNKFLVYQTN